MDYQAKKRSRPSTDYQAEKRSRPSMDSQAEKLVSGMDAQKMVSFETSDLKKLLQEDHLEELQFQKMEFKSVEMDDMVALLSKHKDILKKLCFDGGELDEAFLKNVYSSLSLFAMRNHGLENLVLRDVRLRRNNKKEFPRGLNDLVKWGRSLKSLSLSGVGFDKEDACFIFQAICDGTLPIMELDLSRNSLSGFFKAYQLLCRKKARKGKKGSSGKLQLRALNLRESGLDADDLHLLAYDLDGLLPLLEQIDISENKQQGINKVDFNRSIRVIEEKMK